MSHLYAPFGYMPNPVDPDNCRAAVHNGGRAPGFHQCYRKPKVQRKVQGEKGKVGFCTQHDPEVVAAREKARSDEYAALGRARERIYVLRELGEKIAVALVKADLELPPKLERLVARYRKLTK